MTQTLKVFQDKEEVAQQFAKDLFSLVAGKDKITIALSGGSTPKVLFQLLADQYLDQLDWSKIHFFWGDERCVLPTDEESNYKMTNDILLKHIPANQLNVHRVKGENEPAAEAIRYGKMIEEVVDSANALPQFDLVILGMGDDGHTASIFPHQIELLKSDAICATATHPTSGQIRVTITGKVINNAKNIAFLVTGGGKADRLHEIFAEEGAYQTYPATYITANNGNLAWYLDKAAASKL